MVDTGDLKSPAIYSLRVQVPPPAPVWLLEIGYWLLVIQQASA